ncbi:hypothetical protein KEM60_00858 [Austwickia sp. TVS 96-490-7B]|uniref:stage II sporulation protein M n=1 Tax=Austwickia sp. TVS 96-490-7B TaxID=2830843 RepID=UPI001C58F24E|nr:stage II sporulation protein M [Austwickia sp. TVS 96-490-7B]MBW3084669.1 hypothetical protein [Austwickia sp. TVS 96-490-7B]
MDLDAYVATHLPTWRRLEVLVKRRRLTGPQVDELLDLYQRTATHLSAVRSEAPDPELVGYLSWLSMRARSHAHRPQRASVRAIGTFFSDTFPAALYQARYWWLGTLAVNVIVTAALMWWFVEHPGAESSLLSPGDIRQLVDRDFANYYVENAASSFAFRVWTNNLLVAAMCIAFGALGFPVITALWSNIFNLSVIGALMINAGRADVFFGLISPHGILELTCVFVAGGLGLRLFWSWVEPGRLTRSQSFAASGRSAMSVALGLVLVLGICGLIEGFVTPSSLPTAIRVGIGVLAEVLFLTYVFTVGRWAAHRGIDGDVGADHSGYVAPARD